VCVLMWPPNAKLPRSAPAVLNGRCRACLDMNRPSLGVALQGLPNELIFQIGLLFSLPVHTYLLTCETGY
jgi:hypothetical protein